MFSWGTPQLSDQLPPASKPTVRRTVGATWDLRSAAEKELSMTAMCQNGAPRRATKHWCFMFLPVHTHVTQSRGIWHRFCVFVTLLNVALLQCFGAYQKGGPARVPTSCHSHVEHSARAVCIWHSSLVSLIKWISWKEWHLGRTVSPAAFRIQSSWFPQTKVQKCVAWSIEIPRAPVVLAERQHNPSWVGCSSLRNS